MIAFHRHIALIALALGPLVALAQDQPAKVDRETVLKSIDRLSSRIFQAREDAENELWAMGPAIEPILAEKLDDLEFEAKQRVANVRRKFELGLTPDLPVAIQELIATALQTADTKKRIEATVSLAQQGYFQPAGHLLRRINDPQSRFAVYRQLVGALAQRPASKELDDFQLLLLELAMNEPPKYRVQIFQSIVTNKYLRNRDDEAWLKRLVETLAKCPVEARNSLILSFSFEQSVIHKLTSQELLPQWINMVTTEPNRARRTRLIAKVMGKTVPTWLGGIDPFRGKTSVPNPEIDLEKLFSDLTEDSRIALLDYASEIPRALDVIHEQLGDDYLLKVCNAHPSAAMRGHLIGRLASLQDWPKSGKKAHQILSLIDQQQDAQARHSLITGFLSGIGPRGRSTHKLPEPLIDGLWRKLTTETEQGWQLVAILSTYDAPHLFADKHSKETIERLLRLTTVATPVENLRLIQAPIRNRYFANELAKHGLALELLKNALSLRQANLSYHVSLMLASPAYAAAYKTVELRQQLLDFCLDDKNTRWRHHLANGIVRNQPLLSQLLDDGHFETIIESLIVAPDGTSKEGPSYANLLGGFYASNATIRHLVQSGNVRDLLAIKDSGVPASTVDVVLGRVVQSDEAVSAIFENGQWLDLNQLIDAIEDDSRRIAAKRNLMGQKAFTENLAEQNLLVASLHQFSKDEAWISSRLYLNLISNITFDHARDESELANEFWIFATGLKDGERTRCVEALLTSTWFVPLLNERDQVAPIWESLKETYDADRLYLMASGLARGKNCVSYFEHGRLQDLLRLDELLEAERLPEFHRSLGSSSYVQSWLDSDDQPAKLLHALKQIEPAATRGKFCFAFLTSGALRRVQKHPEFAPQLAKFVSKQPKDQAALLTLAVLSQEGFGNVFAEQDLSDCLGGNIAQAIQIAANDAIWARRPNHWTNLFENLKPQHVRNADEFAPQVWNLVAARKSFNSSLVKSLITSSWFVESIVQRGELPKVLAVLRQRARPYDISSMTMQYAQSAHMIRQLDEGRADVFLALCSLMDESDADRVTRFTGGYSNVETWFATSQQPEKMFRVFDSISDQEQRERFARAFLGSGILSRQRDNQQLVPKIITYTKKHSDAFQLQVAINLLRQYGTSEAAARSELPAFVITKVEQDTLNPEFLQQTISVPIIKQLIEERGLQRKIIDFAFAVEDEDIRRTCTLSVAANSSLQTHLTDAELKQVFDDAQKQGLPQVRRLIRSHGYLVERMIEDGAYDASIESQFGPTPKTAAPRRSGRSTAIRPSSKNFAARNESRRLDPIVEQS